MNKGTRREFLRQSGAYAASMSALPSLVSRTADAQPSSNEESPPNVVLIITDDQGYGDLGCHGNDKIKTPNLDRLHEESLRFKQFYVCPVCSPTRSSLMTGRYNYRTGVLDTYLGRSMMYPDEVTIAELLSNKGYQTGIFGKWHLGDNYPMRAMDQGFQESLVHNGGGIGQPSDPSGNSYFDPILKHNGVEKKFDGYCTDIFTDAAIRFVEDNRDRPFFVYLSTNAPHSPLQISDDYVKPYLALRLDEKTSKVYGMITNIDDNVGTLRAKLEELGLDENTILLFLTDNGPCPSQGDLRYNCGFRDRKGTVYEGGIHVPCFVHWPAKLEAGAEVDRIAAHIDLLPTLMDACGVGIPEDLRLDGRSLLPLMLGETPGWPDRSLFFQWHRGDEPEPFRDCAVRTQQYKLVNGKELYDLEADPGEKKDIADQHPDVASRMSESYETWLKDVGATRGYTPPRIYLGTTHENPVTLSRQDWRGTDGWNDDKLGFWEVKVVKAGTYKITLRFPTTKGVKEAHLKLGDAEAQTPVTENETSCTFKAVALEAGDARLEPWLLAAEGKVGPRDVDVERVD